MRMSLEQHSLEACEVSKLDNEMVGGIMTEALPVQFMVFRAALGNDTVGVKP